MEDITTADLHAVADSLLAKFPNAPKEDLEQLAISLVQRIKEAATVIDNMGKAINWLCDESLHLCDRIEELDESGSSSESMARLRPKITELYHAD